MSRHKPSKSEKQAKKAAKLAHSSGAAAAVASASAVATGVAGDGTSASSGDAPGTGDEKCKDCGKRRAILNEGRCWECYAVAAARWMWDGQACNSVSPRRRRVWT